MNCIHIQQVGMHMPRHPPGVEGEALLHMEELGNYTLKYLTI